MATLTIWYQSNLSYIQANHHDALLASDSQTFTATRFKPYYISLVS